MEHRGFTKSIELFKKATKVIPGGIYGPKGPGFVVPGSFPYYFTRGKGCRLWDIDGNEYIDYMCGYGSQILGYCYDPVKADILTFTYNDTEELSDLFETYRGDIAAVILTPYHHPDFQRQVMPKEGLYTLVENLCEKEDALFILDDIRCNFRLSLQGSHHFFGCSPDLVTMGKSIANGQPISILMGTDRVKKWQADFL